MLADAGQKYITTSIIQHPWNAQTYDPYSTMIKWIKSSDGRWEFDYSLFLTGGLNYAWNVELINTLVAIR